MKCVVCGENIPTERKRRRPTTKTCSPKCSALNTRSNVNRWQREHAKKVNRYQRRWRKNNPELWRSYLRVAQAKYSANPEHRFKQIYEKYDKDRVRFNSILPTQLHPYSEDIFEEFRQTWLKTKTRGTTMPHLLYAVCLHFVRKRNLDYLFKDGNTARGLSLAFNGRRGKCHTKGKKIYKTLCQEIPEYAEVRWEYYRKKGVCCCREQIIKQNESALPI